MPINFKTLPDQPKGNAEVKKVDTAKTDRPSFQFDLSVLPDQKKAVPEIRRYSKDAVREPNEQEQSQLIKVRKQRDIDAMRKSPNAGDLRTDAFFKGIGAPVQTNDVENAFPVTHAIGSLVGLITAGQVTKGIAPAVAFNGTLKNLPTAVRMVAGKIAQSGSTFGLKQIIAALSDRATGGDKSLKESAKEIAGSAAMGAGLGAVGGIPKPIARIPAEAAYGFVSAKLQGSNNIEAGINAGVFALFGVFNQADLSKEYKRAAFIGARKAVIDRLSTKVPAEKAEAVADRFFSYIFRSNGAMKRGKDGLEIDWGKLKVKDLDWFNKNVSKGWKISIKAEPKGSAKAPRPESDTQSAMKELMGRIQPEGAESGMPTDTPPPQQSAPAPAQPAVPQVDEGALAQVAQSAGATYRGVQKGFTKKDGTVKDDLVYFDPPAKDGEDVTTLALKASEYTPENVKKKIESLSVQDSNPEQEAQLKQENKIKKYEYKDKTPQDFRPNKGETGDKYFPLSETDEEILKSIDPRLYKGVTEANRPIFDNTGLHVAITSTRRTQELQDLLTKQGKKTATKSKHIEGKASDLVFRDTEGDNLDWRTMSQSQKGIIRKEYESRGLTVQDYEGFPHIHVEPKEVESVNKADANLQIEPEKTIKEKPYPGVVKEIRPLSGVKKVATEEAAKNDGKQLSETKTYIKTDTGAIVYDSEKGESIVYDAEDTAKQNQVMRARAVAQKEHAVKKEPSYTVTEVEIIPTRQGIVTRKKSSTDYDSTGKEIDSQKVDKTKKEDYSLSESKQGVENEISNDRKEKKERQAQETGEREISRESGQPVRRSSDAGQAPGDKQPGSASTDRKSYELTEADEVGKGTSGEKIESNLKAIELVKQIESEGRLATDEEKKVLVKYTGWGGLSQIFSTKWQAQAKRLKELTTSDEFKNARASTINAHYTSPEVVQSMWNMVKALGFKGGNVLEPAAGVGNFIGFGPKKGVKYHAVELDTLTGSILKNIYQDATVHVKGFEDVAYPAGKFDLVISNVPFASYKPFDAKAKELGIPKGLSLHDYFFAKSLALAKDNGVVAFITSRFTMDKQSSTFRKWIGERADLVAAYRLPSTAFKGNAGTEVVTDIIILKKRPEADMPAGQAWENVKPQQFGEDTEYYNEYYHSHPSHIIGKLDVGKGLYKEKELIVTGTGNVAEQLKELTGSSLSELSTISTSETTEDETKTHDIESVPDATAIKNNAYVTKDGRIYQKQGEEMVKVDVSGTEAQRLIQLTQVRDAYRKVLHEQLINDGDQNLKQLLKDLNNKYDAFVKKYNNLNSAANVSAFIDDPDSPLLLSLEKESKDAKGKKIYTKTEAFTKRTVKHHKMPEKAENTTDGLRISLSEKGRFDAGYVAKLTGKTKDAVIKELEDKGEIFKDPALDKHVTRDEYLSGNVKAKYKLAEKNGLERNKNELADVIPVDLSFEDISVRIGTPFIQIDDYKEFLAELLDINKNSYQLIIGKTEAGVWSFDYRGYSPNNTAKWGIPEYRANQIIEAIANNKAVKVFDTYKLSDGNTQRVLNEEKTALAEQKAEEIKIEFQSWIWKDSARREKYVNLYNETYNNTVTRSFNGDHLVLPGLSDVFKLRPNQKNAIWRIVTNNAVMAAHEVGAGKTLTVIAGAMESKRLGIINKPMIVVPKNTLPQWQREWMRAYPGARILVADEKNFTAKKRKMFLARVATGNWDGIIIADSSFGRIGVSKDTYENFVAEKIEQLRDEKQRLKDAGARISVKNVERSIKGLEARLAEKLKQYEKDDVVSFEELGIDSLFVDEADMFKNLSYTTTMQGIKGLGAPSGSQKAEDLLLKIKYLQKKKNSKVVFATGTPISNTMAEVYTMMQYLQPEQLEAYGAKSFDDWAALFGEVKSELEVDVTGGRYKTVSRFSRFVNIPELMSALRNVWDIQTASMLEASGTLVKGIHLPNIKSGKPEMIIGSARQELKEYIQALMQRADALKGKKVEKGSDNMLVILSDGIKASLDMRMIDGTLPADPNSKIEKAIVKVSEVYSQSSKKKGTQLIFIDRPSPADASVWNPYHYMKAQLIKRGVKESDIAFIHDHDTSAKKSALYEKVNEGEVRILFGSTDKMGAGTNVQERLVALHHVSVPSKMRPRDITQRNGRIVRSGNTNKEVEIYFYSTKGSLDTFIWQMLESKAKSIDQIMSHKDGIREFSEDLDEYAILKAASSDNPLIKEKVELDKEVKKLQALQKAQMQQKFNAEDQLKRLPKRIAETKKLIDEVKSDIAATPDKLDKDTFKVRINGKEYKDKESAHKEMIKIESAIAARHRKSIGEYQGYSLEIDKTGMLDVTKLNVVSPKGMIYEKELSSSATGTFQAIENAVYKEPAIRVSNYESNIARLEKEILSSKEMTTKAIDTEKLKERSARLAEVNRLLKEAQSSDMAKEDETRKKLDADEPPIEGPDAQIGLSIKVVNQPKIDIAEGLPLDDKKGYTGEKGFDSGWMAPMRALHDWLFTFGKQKRIDPSLYDEFTKSYHFLSTRVENSVLEAKDFFGKKLTSSDRAELTFAREEKSYKIRPGLVKESEAFNRILDKIEDMLKESGVFQMGFIESKTAELLDKKAELEMSIESMQKSKELTTDEKVISKIDAKISRREKKLDDILKDLEQIEDLNFVTHRSVARAVMNKKFAQEGNKERYLANVRRVSYKYKRRTGITPLRILYEEGLLNKHDVDAFNILAMQLSEMRFRIVMKGLFDYFKGREMLLHKNTKNVPAYYRRISPIITGIIASEYNDYYIHPLALEGLQEIKDTLTSKGGFVKAVFSTIKTGQFVKPSIIWVYDALQMAYGGALGVKTPMYMAKAAKAVYLENSEYRTANQYGAFQQMYLPVVGGKSETEMIQLAARATLKDMPMAVKILEKILDMPLTKDQGLKYLITPYRALSRFTWQGDKIMRMTSYYAFTDMGYSQREAAKLAGNIHGAYADIAKKPRDLFGYIFFVHSFRILMPKLMLEILAEPFKLGHEQFIKGNKVKGRDWKRALKAFAALILIPYMYDRYLTKHKGYKRDVPLWKYRKPLDKDFDIVLNVNSIISQPFKWISRLMKYSPSKEAPRFIQGFKAWWKWEQHPLYRIIGDIAENKRSLGGGKVYNPNQTQPQIAKDMIEYTIRESFRMIDLFAPEDDEHLRNRYNIPKAEQDGLINQNFAVFEQVMNKLFGYAYVTRNKEYWRSYAKGRVAQEFKRRLYQTKGPVHTARITAWYRRAIKYIDTHEKKV